MADISKIKTLDGTTYDLKDATARSNKVEKSGDTMTGNLVIPAVKVANTYYGISFDRTSERPVETILYTGIKWVSSSHMPVVHVTGYAYGLQSPVEFKIGFYIYGDKIGYCGVTNMGAWNPDVYLFKYTRSSIDYVAVGFAGSCYFLQLSVDLQDEMGKFANVVTDQSAWSWSFLTTTGTIPSADGGSTCIQVPYKADILNPSKVNGHTINSDVPANAKFTDTTYESKAAASGGTALSLVTTGEKYAWNNKGSGTITGIKMNGASKGTSGVVDLGTVITAHQDISGKLNSSLKGAANGLAELDANGKVPSSQLPSYVDDVLEYVKQASFPSTGETGKIYIDLATNKTYRWSGSAYVEISQSLALGTTSSTAYRGDYGNTAYTHAVTNKGSAFTSGLYKITTNSEGHVTAATAVTKTDITALGIPGSDTNTTYTANTSKLVTTTIPNVTSAGSAPTLGTAIPADDITAWTTNTPTAFEIIGEKLKITAGKAATLSYTAKSIPNVTSVGSAPTLGTAITVATGALASNGAGSSVVTGITGT